MKAIVVIDINEKYIGEVGTKIQAAGQKYNCKWELKHIPQKIMIDKEYSEIRSLVVDRYEELTGKKCPEKLSTLITCNVIGADWFINGYNYCIDEILGDNNETDI